MIMTPEELQKWRDDFYNGRYSNAFQTSQDAGYPPDELHCYKLCAEFEDLYAGTVIPNSEADFWYIWDHDTSYGSPERALFWAVDYCVGCNILLPEDFIRRALESPIIPEYTEDQLRTLLANGHYIPSNPDKQGSSQVH